MLLGLSVLFKKHFWPLAISTCISIFGISNNWSFKSDRDDGTANYAVLSYNVRLFDLYNWLDGTSWSEWRARTDNGATLDSLYHTITKSEADFICIQEFYNQTKGDYETYQYIKANGYQYAHTAYGVENGVNKYGLATFSKYPIIYKDVKRFKGSSLNTGIQITDIKTTTDTIRIVNVHLRSFKLGRSDYKYLNELSDSALNKIDPVPSKKLLHKIKQASIKRAQQLDQLLLVVDNSPHPVLLCGDFNELPNSYLYRTITNRLNDSFQEVGFGFGSTLISRVPGLRIDYVFHSPDIKPVSHKVIHRELSDHFPVFFEFKTTPGK